MFMSDTNHLSVGGKLEVKEEPEAIEEDETLGCNWQKIADVELRVLVEALNIKQN